MIYDPVGLEASACITVSGAPSTSVVTATLGGDTVTGTYVEADGAFRLMIRRTGTWNVTAAKGGLSITKTVEVTAPGPYALTLIPPTVAIGTKYALKNDQDWTCEQTGLYTIEIHGGGGGGGGSLRVSTTIYTPGGDGGGSGAIGTDILLEAGKTYTVICGECGNGGSMNGSGSNGDGSRFGDIVSISGGKGGSPSGGDGQAGTITRNGTGFRIVGKAGGNGGGSYPNYGKGGAGGSGGMGGNRGTDGGVFLELTAYV